jgi:menaquinone-dependent protoporphyrinogen oxidase
MQNNTRGSTHAALVAYASKYGTTAEIANKIGEALTRAGLTVNVVPANEVENLRSYGAIVLGSAVYAGQWLKPAAKFLKDNQAVLATRPLWLFSSGPTGPGDPVTILGGWRFPQTLQPIADHLKPRDIALFHGAIRLDKLHLSDKLILRAMRVEPEDSRDWNDIARWAQGIAQQLAQPITEAVF